jgi:transcriptional regulator with XRE-family HTH domain
VLFSSVVISTVIVMNIGLAIRYIRQRLSITQNELAQMCCISSTSLSQIELGLKQPSKRTISKISAVLSCPESIMYLLAIEQMDVVANKREVYGLVYPSIRSLALLIASSGHMNNSRSVELARNIHDEKLAHC